MLSMQVVSLLDFMCEFNDLACVTSGDDIIPCVTRNFCQSCLEFSSNSRCQSCPQNCEEYSSLRACESCNQGYFLNESTCERCPNNCQKCSLSTSCEVCDETYFLYQSHCFQSCPGATFISSNTCKGRKINLLFSLFPKIVQSTAHLAYLKRFVSLATKDISYRILCAS